MPTSKKGNVNSLKKAFLEAAKTGNAIIVKELLNVGPSKDLLHLDFKEGNDDTPLHLACKNGHLEVVKLLLDNGASKNIDMISSALYYAVKLKYNKFEVVGELLKHGAIIDFTLQNGETILMYPWVNENEKVLKFLIENGTFKQSQRLGKSRLHWSVEYGLPDLVEKCLKNGDNPNIKNSRGETPYDNAKEFYETAIESKNFYHRKEILQKIMSILVQYGANEVYHDDNAFI